MSVLMNQTKNIQVLSHLEEAQNFYSRAKGLLGKKFITDDYALYIHKCSSIHTFFMNFPIDVAFIDKNLKVVKIIKNLKPYRMTFPHPKYKDVIEFKAGFINNLNLEIGDQLYVGH